jgi:short subunit dehydrogenase-like uncharacterized protein
MIDVVVYGATGYSGRLVCAELRRRGVAFVAAGRDARKLEALPKGPSNEERARGRFAVVAEARGVLTSAQAFGARALLDGIAGSGVRWGFSMSATSHAEG